MQDLQVFQNTQFGNLEILTIEGKEWFPAIKVAEILGYTNPRKAIRDHTKERGVTIRSVIDSLGRNQDKKFIDEGNLYRLITRSKLPQADEFEEWVFEDVLPSIRKHGIYATDNVIENTLNNPDYIINILTEYKKEKEHNLLLQQQVGELKPKADYYDQILKSKKLITVNAIAKDYGMSAQALNKILHDLKVQFKQSGQWLLYAKYHDKGYTSSEPHKYTKKDGTEDFKLHTKWTQKGRIFLYNLLKDNDILPTIEQTT
ncbi:phage antirepressor [Staphylococcus haemolyticus]|uniref:Phage antirepressor n=1 Tax=Staphylococcus devriesei TaxID=586733 RepID=A0A2T4KTM6_9STAP|nr:MULTISPECIES: phage antirepressor KilAC domain-containing protein [Staphylococcus]MCE4987169.1 phage antirepressor KilAC domain-containing protein [Staphylococcus haemolyticus]MCE5049680.1 phage antirepressor KilAC domain-containing protein [Staphylococcus haemolyticus]PTE74094.1 phage antirepressor [Staphylococcus devriesei]PTF12783.1 phage antirepressor [Staphylococcus devriesei]PTF19479.1 phage antirepressor [Staphylococcus devriesei]